MLHGLGVLNSQKQCRSQKILLRSSSIPVHFDSTKKIVMSCDASPTGLVVVLSHITEDGESQ